MKNILKMTLSSLLLFMSVLAFAQMNRAELATSIKFKDGLYNQVNSTIETLAAGNDNSWHSGGKITVELISTAMGVGFIKKGTETTKDVVSKNIDDIAEEVEVRAGKKAVQGVGNSLSFVNGWTKQSIIAKVNELKAVGQKLNPTQYLSPTYITNHLNKFKTKASNLVTGDTYDNFILGKATVGRPDGLFISTADDVDAVIAKANGNVSIFEQELGIPSGSWQGKGGIVRIDINNPENFNLRIPDGSEAGANALWEPGGLTSGGKVEAVTNPIPTTNINASKIIQ